MPIDGDLCNPGVTKCVHSPHTSMVLPSSINLTIINLKREAVLIGLELEEKGSGSKCPMSEGKKK